MTSDSTDQDLDPVIPEILEHPDSAEAGPDETVISPHPEYADQLRDKLKHIAEARKAAGQIPYAGQKIRHYVLLEQIGEGGFGTVWRARDSKLECDVAVKIPRKEKLKSDDIERFIREARVSAQLRNHPNIVTVHEADWEDEIAFIASDFLEGDSLCERMQESSISFNEATDLVITICGALHYAHELGIVHRDLKPDNILLDRSDVPHVTDFGLAKQESQLIATEVGKIMGTAAYMSPEQAKGTSELADRRSDVFSLGVILFELLTRERPFRGSVPRILRQIIDVDPPRPRSFDPKIPADLETICLKCLEKDPDLRYQTIAELGEDLKRYRKHEPILASPISTAGKLWRWCKRNPRIPWLSLTLILVTFAAMITAGYFLDRQVAAMQKQLRQQTEQTLKFTNYYAMTDARHTLEKLNDYVREMAADPELKNKLIAWNTQESKTREEAIKQLQEEADQSLDPEHIRFPSQLDSLQRQLQLVADQSSGRGIFSRFVCDSEGFQISRVKKEHTLGTDFFFRSYVTGQIRDLPDDTTYDEEKLRWAKDSEEPQLSDIFLTHTGKAWVIAISVPIWENGEFQGVVGIFVELGDLVKLPPHEKGAKSQIKLSMFDARKNRNRSLKTALPIQHDDLRAFLEALEKGEIQQIPTADLDDPESEITDPFVKLRNYQDPFDSDKNKKWLAVRNNHPISEELDGLYVVIQIPESDIEDPGRHLRTNLGVLGLSVVGFAAAILIPMWIIIIRRVVVKE